MEANLRFSKEGMGFQRELNKRVHQYFKENNLSKNGGWAMRGKTMVMFMLYLTPYVLLLTGVIQSGWLALLASAVIGIGLAGIGLSVMHDACHGAYSSNPKENDWVGYSLNFLGASSFNWKIQHNVLHHSYTNVIEHDEDIDNRGLFRFTPYAPLKAIHRYQHIYAWPFYSLMTLFWVLLKDFFRFAKYDKEGLIKQVNGSKPKELAILIATKVWNLVFSFGLPLMFTDFTFGQILLGFLTAHLIAGFLLALVFQPAHVSDEISFIAVPENGELPFSFAEHQIRTTRNFANENRWFSWYAGGLNFQIEHHLFPHICHIHYRKISPIVRQTAQEFGLPYENTPSIWQALVTHTKHLKNLGRLPEIPNEASVHTAGMIQALPA